MTTYEPRIRHFTAGDLLDQRGDLLDHLTGGGNSGVTIRAGSMFRQLIVGTMAGHGNGNRRPEDFVNVPGLIHAHLEFGEVYRISADMTELITHAAALLDDTDRWHKDLLPTEAGFARFEKPLVLHDARGNDMLIHAMTWGPAPLGDRATGAPTGEMATLVTMWNDLHVEPDFYAHQMLSEYGRMTLDKICGRWSFIGAETLTDGVRMGPALLDPTQLSHNHDPAVSMPFTNNFRLIMALCMLMDQTIVVTSAERPNAYARRRAKERKLPQSDITVVTLRRAYRKEGDGHSVSHSANREWHHRWIVRGHWRWARVGPGRQETRRVWVSGHVKGPEGAPLRITTKVYDVKR